MAQHAYVIRYVPSVNLDEGVWSDSLCGFKTYVNSFSLSPIEKNLHRLLLCIPPQLVCFLTCQTLGIAGVHGDAENYEFLDDIKCSQIEVGQN